MAASVIPAASAMRTASAVGAETDTITGAPIAALFCTISTDTRLVRRMIPSLAAMDERASAPDELVERVVTANVLAQGNDAARGIPKRRCVNRARLEVEFLTRRHVPHGGHDLLRRKLPARPDNGRGTHGFRH